MLDVFLGGFERDFRVFHGATLAEWLPDVQWAGLLASRWGAWQFGRIEPPEISVLIPAYNEERLIADVLSQVRASFAAVAGGRTYEILVCDNASTDGTAEVARAHGAEVVFEAHNQISRARNAAARAARGRWLIFLDADTLLRPDLLAETLRRIDGGKVCAGGAVIQFGAEKQQRWAGMLLGVWNGISVRLRLAAGSYIFCPRAAWEEVGGFDEGIYAGEEILFSRRLHQWARARGLRFEVLTKTPVVTSARKLEWYGQGPLLWRMVLLLRPGALRNREKCGLWYTRPAG